MIPRAIFITVILFKVLYIQAQDSTEYFFNLGISRYNIKDYHGAASAFSNALSITPEFGSAIHNRASALLNLGDIKNACGNYNNIYSLGRNKFKVKATFICDTEGTISDTKTKINYSKQIFEQIMKDDSSRSCYDVISYDLALRANPTKKMIAGSNTIYFHTLEPTNNITLDLFNNMHIDSILWKNKSVSYKRGSYSLTIEFSETLSAGTSNSVKIVYSGEPAVSEDPPWEEGMLWKKNKSWFHPNTEHAGGRIWWPNKAYPIDYPDSINLTLEIPKKYTCITNGTLMTEETTDKRYKRYIFSINKPLDPQSLYFYAGRFDKLTEKLDGLNINYHSLPHNKGKAQIHSKSIKRMLKYQNTFWGNHWSKGNLNIVMPLYPNLGEEGFMILASIFDYEQNFSIPSWNKVVMNRSLHQYWNNVYLPEDITDKWLLKGLAAYTGLMFIEEKFGYSAYMDDIFKKMKILLNLSPIAKPDSSGYFFTNNDLYDKSIIVLHNLKCIINDDDLFKNALKTYVNNCNNRLSTVSFIQHMNEATGKNLTPFFDMYLYSTDLPILSYEFKKEGENIILNYNWKNMEPGFEMPFCVVTDNNKMIRLNGTNKRQETTLEGIKYFSIVNQWINQEIKQDSPRNAFTLFTTEWKLN